CLRPGIMGLSDRIQVRATIDRFLEHERIFRFENGGSREIYLSSADWMPRNFHRRVEILIPLLDPLIAQRVEDILKLLHSDSIKTWELSADGSYARVLQAQGPPVRAQAKFIELARERTKADPHRQGRFHILHLPTPPPGENDRKLKNNKKKKLG